MKHLLSLLYWAIFLIAVALAFFIVMRAIGMNGEVRVVNEYSLSLRDETGKVTEFEYGPSPSFSSPDFYDTVRSQMIASGADFIDADLANMKVSVYKLGQKVVEVPIVAKGEPGSWFETPSGLYKVEQKYRKHRSSLQPVSMEWNVAFQGNYFIHGWPRYVKSGKPVESQYSAGCIRLSDADAKKVYEQAVQGMPVLVYAAEPTQDFSYSIKAPTIQADSYFVADAGNRYVFMEKDSALSRPLYDFAKLINAFVVSEYLNFDRPIKVTQDMIIGSEKPRVVVGKSYTPYDLIYPLLLERSNEAGEMLSRPLGKRYFINLMNRKADALGMSSTEIVDPVGLANANVTTARDMYELARGLVSYRDFILRSTDHTKDIYKYGPTVFGTDIRSTNPLIGMAGYEGGMVTRGEGEKLSALAVFTLTLKGESRTVVFSVFNSSDIRADIESLRAFIENSYK